MAARRPAQLAGLLLVAPATPMRVPEAIRAGMLQSRALAKECCRRSLTLGGDMRGNRRRRDARRERKRAVIIGGGFARMATAHALRHADAEVVLIDRRDHHIFQPLLSQVATAVLSPAEIAGADPSARGEGV